MSYDIYLENGPSPCATCGRGYENPDVTWCPTYNLAPIFRIAFNDEDGLRWLNGKLAEGSLPTLKSALERLQDPARRTGLIALEPSNKWGTLEDATNVVRGLLDLAEKYPAWTWRIS